MYDLSQAVTVPAPWPIDVAIIVCYGIAGWFIFWPGPTYLRRESQNMTIRPLQCLVILRMLGAIFGFLSSSPFKALLSAKDYMNWLFAICWDLGFIALLFQQLCCVASVLRLRIPPHYNIARYTWATIAILLIVIAEAAQGANITAGYAWTKQFTRGLKITLSSLSAIRGLFRIYLLFCLLTLVLEIIAFTYALLSQRRRKGPLGTLESAQRIAFFASLPPMAVYLVFACIRLWTGVEPSILYFGCFQVASEAVVAWIYIVLACYILRWDHWRQMELAHVRDERKRAWENALKDGAEYTKWLHSSDNSGARNTSIVAKRKGKPCIVALAEIRFGIRADAPLLLSDAEKQGHDEEYKDMLGTLALLKQFADIVTSNLLLERDDLMPLCKRQEDRVPDVLETEVVVVAVLLEKFSPITQESAERLAREWSTVFCMDPTQLEESAALGRIMARKSSVMMSVQEV